MKLGIVQTGADRRNPAANAAAVAAEIGAAAAEGCSLVAFPECILTGYIFDSRPELQSAALGLGGAEVAEIVEACRSGAIHAVVGLFERDGADVYNAALLIGPEGIVGRHRKRHLPFLGGDRFADLPADLEPPVFATAIGRIGLAICYELRFPEVVRTLALAGADIVVLPTNWPPTAAIVADHFAPVRAAENLVYLLVADRNDSEAGARFLGGSQIVDPAGRVLVRAGTASGLFTAEVDLERARDKTIVIEAGAFELSPFKDRRPETYRL